MDWFYARNNQQNGPVTNDALISMLRSGAVLPSDLVWREGMANWVAAGALPELAGVVSGPGSTVPYLTPSPQPMGQPIYAGFWLRFVAYILDGILMFVVSFVLDMAIRMGNPMLMPPRPAPGTNPFPLMIGAMFGVAGLVKMAINWLYFALMESSTHQATLGKMALGLVVTDMEGHRISFGRATGRYFGKIISGITLYIGFMMAGWTQQKQALHDIMASCLVLRKP